MSKTRTGLILIGLLIATGPAAVDGAMEDESNLVATEMIVGMQTVKPGETFWVGVQFTIKPHWHIYWHNPGDSGMATDIDWTVPEGWRVSELHWPIPTRFSQPGDIVGYGYENQVTLLARVTVPQDARVGQSFALAASPTWLVCKDVCLPGESHLKATVRVGEASKPQHAEHFKKAAALVPKTDAAKVTETQAGSLTKVEMKFDQPVKDLATFPFSSSIAVAMAPTVDPAAPKTVRLAYQYESAMDEPAGLLVTWKNPDGTTSGQNVGLK